MTTRKKFDVAVIGGGPGGYVAAIQAVQLGKSVALIEKDFLGGTCLNVGCIPTKTLLASSSLLKKIKQAEEFGIIVGEVRFEYLKIKERKDRVLQKIRTSLEGLIRANQIPIFSGKASFESPYELKIQGKDNLFVQAEKIIIATGSEAVNIPKFPWDHKKIFNSSSILDITKVPKKLIIVGGGYIGCEFASLFAELESEVVLLEAFDSLVPLLGSSASQALTDAFRKQGIQVRTSVVVETITPTSSGIVAQLAGGEKIEAEMALVAVGRKPFVQGLQLEKAGVATTEKGFIMVDDQLQTNVDGIYAIGDVTGKWMLAHVASHQGMVAAKNACGHKETMYYHAVPSVVFTEPEIATVGITLEEALKKGYAATSGKFPFQVLGKSLAAGETQGFAQIVTDKNTHQILGAQVVGHEASNLIGEITLAIQNELTLECLIETIHAHPTVAEAWLEAALIANETPIHAIPRKR